MIYVIMYENKFNEIYCIIWWYLEIFLKLNKWNRLRFVSRGNVEFEKRCYRMILLGCYGYVYKMFICFMMLFIYYFGKM